MTVIQADLAGIYSQLGQFGAARTHLEAAARSSDRNPELAKRVGDLLTRMELEDEAQAWYTEADRRRQLERP